MKGGDENGGDGGRLTQCLQAIAAAQGPSAERKMLQRYAVELFLGGSLVARTVPPKAEEREIEHRLEEVLLLIGKAAGHLGRRMPVPKALDWLRRSGQSELASRVGKLSKGRNIASHPDEGLLDDVLVHCQASSSSGSSSETEQQSEAEKLCAVGGHGDAAAGGPRTQELEMQLHTQELEAELASKAEELETEKLAKHKYEQQIKAEAQRPDSPQRSVVIAPAACKPAFADAVTTATAAEFRSEAHAAHKPETTEAMTATSGGRWRGLEPNGITYNASISNCTSIGLCYKINGDVISYNDRISACEKNHRVERAMKLFVEMKQRGLIPDVITYNALIRSRKMGHKVEQASELLDEMRRRGLEPNSSTYYALISVGAVFEKPADEKAKQAHTSAIESYFNELVKVSRSSSLTIPK